MERMNETIKRHTVKIQIATICSVILFVVGFSWWAGGAFKENELEHERLREDYYELKATVDENSSTNIEIKVKLSSIETQLAAINQSLLELKKNLE